MADGKVTPIIHAAMLWIHGGGYVLGTADGEDLGVKSIVSAIGCAAVSVAYRLAKARHVS